MSAKQNRTKKSNFFKPGTLIEARPEEDWAAWYEANIIRTHYPNPNVNYYVFDVEYKSLQNEKDDMQLVESLRDGFIRPIPPLHNVKQDFELGDVVDAFRMNGWWIGVVTRITTQNNNTTTNDSSKDNGIGNSNSTDDNDKVSGDGDDGKVYEVSFSRPHGWSEFREAKLRMHLDWVEGAWVKSHESKNRRAGNCEDKRSASPVEGAGAGIDGGQETVLAVNQTIDQSTTGQTGMHSLNNRRVQNEDSSSGNGSEVANVTEEEGVKEAYTRNVVMGAGKYQCPTTSSSSFDTQQCRSGFVEQVGSSTAAVEGNGSEPIDPNNKLETMENSAVVELSGGKLIDPNNQDLEISAVDTAVEVHTIDPKNGKGKIEGRASAIEGNAIDFNDQIYPFKKTYPLWKKIESLEIFQAIPQRPHFQMLIKDCPESCQEGIAIGYMVDFVTVAKRVTELRLEDPKSTVDGFLKTLAKLEQNGFDVKIIRDRLTYFLRKKDEIDFLFNQQRVHENQITEHKCEKEKIVEEISVFDKQLKEIQEKLNLALSLWENVENEMKCLELKLKSTRQEISNLSASKQATKSP